MAVVSLLNSHAAVAVGPAQPLIIQLYDYSDLTASQTMRLTEVAGLVLSHAGIHVTCVPCRGALAEVSGCEGERKANEIIVRLVPAGPRSLDVRTEGLGSSVVTAEGGQFSTIYVAAVREAAVRWGVDFHLMLGYAVAHEIGHCLLGPGHSAVGLMRPRWTRTDAQEISRLALGLSKQEALRAGAWLAKTAAPAVRKNPDAKPAHLPNRPDGRSAGAGQPVGTDSGS